MDLQLIEKFTKMMNYTGRVPVQDRVTVREALTSADAHIMMPKVIQLVVTEASESLLQVANLFHKVTLTEGRSLEFIHFGALRAHEIMEGGEYPNQNLNLAGTGISPTVDVKVKKYGLKVAVTDEAISDSNWDIIGMHLKAGGRALARKKEEVCMEEIRTHGHVVFDADKYNPGEAGYPSGRGFDGSPNGSLSAEDLIDMNLTILAAGFHPTDLIMHPLTWSLFHKNNILDISSQAALGQGTGGQDPRTYTTSNALGLNVIFSPFVPFDAANKKFDLYIIDRNNIGVMVVRDEISTEEFSDPTRDIQTLKLRERYGVGILNGGLALSVAKNIPLKRTWPAPERRFAEMTLPAGFGEGMDDVL
jgi:hypothetical protein